LLNQRRKQSYAPKLIPLRFIDVNRGARVSMKVGVPWGGGESNQIPAANILAGENSKSIALRGNKAIKNVPARGWRGS
jgi:hypothetical protein